jgi:hypothetical protein
MWQSPGPANGWSSNGAALLGGSLRVCMAGSATKVFAEHVGCRRALITDSFVKGVCSRSRHARCERNRCEAVISRPCFNGRHHDFAHAAASGGQIDDKHLNDRLRRLILARTGIHVTQGNNAACLLSKHKSMICSPYHGFVTAPQLLIAQGITELQQ